MIAYARKVLGLDQHDDRSESPQIEADMEPPPIGTLLGKAQAIRLIKSNPKSNALKTKKGSPRQKVRILYRKTTHGWQPGSVVYKYHANAHQKKRGHWSDLVFVDKSSVPTVFISLGFPCADGDGPLDSSEVLEPSAALVGGARRRVVPLSPIFVLVEGIGVFGFAVPSLGGSREQPMPSQHASARFPPLGGGSVCSPIRVARCGVRSYHARCCTSPSLPLHSYTIALAFGPACRFLLGSDLSSAHLLIGFVDKFSELTVFTSRGSSCADDGGPSESSGLPSFSGAPVGVACLRNIPLSSMNVSVEEIWVSGLGVVAWDVGIIRP